MTGAFQEELVSAMLAGSISFLAAWGIKSLEHTKAYREKKVERADETISQFSIYIESWRRLMVIASLASTRSLSKEEQERLERYVLERDMAKHRLSSSIAVLPLYFPHNVASLGRAFRDWDRQQGSKRLNELPHITDWEVWLERLSCLLKSNI